MLDIADRYEQQGRPEAALRVYDHLLSQQPKHEIARQRRDLLAQQGVRPHAGSQDGLQRPLTASELMARAHQRNQQMDYTSLAAAARELRAAREELLATREAIRQGETATEVPSAPPAMARLDEIPAAPPIVNARPLIANTSEPSHVTVPDPLPADAPAIVAAPQDALARPETASGHVTSSDHDGWSSVAQRTPEHRELPKPKESETVTLTPQTPAEDWQTAESAGWNARRSADDRFDATTLASADLGWRPRTELLPEAPSQPERDMTPVVRRSIAPADPIVTSVSPADETPIGDVLPERDDLVLKHAEEEQLPVVTPAESESKPVVTEWDSQLAIEEDSQTEAADPFAQAELSESPQLEPRAVVDVEESSSSTVAESLPEIRPANTGDAAPLHESADQQNASPVTVVSSATPAEVESSDWLTTDLRHHAVSEPATEESLLADPWEPTRLVALCDGLPEDLKPAVLRLESADPLDRAAALLELGEAGARAEPAAVAVHALLEDPDPLVTVHAAGTLREISGDAWNAVHTLARCLEHDDPQVVRLAAYLLGNMGPEAMDAVPALESVRRHDSGVTGMHAAEALTRIAPGDGAAVDTLLQGLKNENRDERWFAAVSLGTVTGQREQEVAEALKLALYDRDPQVRAAVCLSLGGLGQPALCAVQDLRDTARYDGQQVREAAETALACLDVPGPAMSKQ